MTQGTLDLFGDAPEPTVVHMLMPDMLTACRRCTMWDCSECERRVERTASGGWTLTRTETTCPECLEHDIPAEFARMTGHQAEVTR